MFSENYRNIENINRNKELLLKYPFLKPTNKYVDFYVDKDVDYDYSFTMADLFFDGYLIAFGNDLFDEIKNELIKTNDLNNCLLIFIGAGNLFHIFLKESLLFFEFSEDFHGNKYNLNCILNKYKDEMKFICPICGNKKYYIGEKFLCDNCANEFKTRIYDIDFTPNLKPYSIVDYPYDYIVDFDKTINDNQKLIENLPFLMPTKENIDFYIKEYDYSFTALDFIPVDFLRKYGIHFIEEIDLELMKNNNRNKCHFFINKLIGFIDNINVIFDDDFNNDDHSIYKINFIINKYRKLAKELN